MAQKLRIIILLHGELVTFNFHFPETQKVFMLTIFGRTVVDMSMSPKTNYSCLWRHRLISKSARNTETCWETIFRKDQKSKHMCFRSLDVVHFNSSKRWTFTDSKS